MKIKIKLSPKVSHFGKIEEIFPYCPDTSQMVQNEKSMFTILAQDPSVYYFVSSRLLQLVKISSYCHKIVYD